MIIDDGNDGDNSNNGNYPDMEQGVNESEDKTVTHQNDKKRQVLSDEIRFLFDNDSFCKKIKTLTSDLF